MADLGNQKIKDTYQLVLQADASGNLQKLDGTSPSLTINSAFTYNVGTLVDGYVLKSNGSGVASWGALNADIYLSAATLNGTTLELDTTSGNTLSVDLSSLAGDSYWSANTDGSISNSGLTGNVGIGTSTPNKQFTVVGDISGTTDLYLGSSTHTASTITAENKLTIKGHSSTNDYLTLENDYIHMFIDGASAFVVQNTPGDGMIVLNASSKNMDTKIVTDDGTNAIHVDAGLNLVRIREKALIGPGTPTDYSQSLYVSGSSLFYSGGTSLTNTKAISAVGHISGTTDLYIDNKVGIGTSNPNKTLTVVGDISANTINFSLIDGGTF